MSESEEKPGAPVSDRDVTGLVPTGLRVSAALALRFIVVIAGLYAIVWLAGFFSHLLVPVAIALLLAALMAPPSSPGSWPCWSPWSPTASSPPCSCSPS